MRMTYDDLFEDVGSVPVREYVYEVINDCEGGIAESADQRSRNCCLVLSRLIELLSDRGILSCEEVVRIVGDHQPNAEFVTISGSGGAC